MRSKAREGDVRISIMHKTRRSWPVPRSSPRRPVLLSFLPTPASSSRSRAVAPPRRDEEASCDRLRIHTPAHGTLVASAPDLPDALEPAAARSPCVDSSSPACSPSIMIAISRTEVRSTAAEQRLIVLRGVVRIRETCAALAMIALESTAPSLATTSSTPAPRAGAAPARGRARRCRASM